MSRRGSVGRREAGGAAPSAGVTIKRAYEAPLPSDGWRVLVDRVWPRGLTRDALRLDERRPDLGPSAELRRWFGHDPVRWDEFRRRYRAELTAPAAVEGLDELAERARHGRLTLVYSARDEAHNQAVVLAEAIEERLRGGSRRRAARGGGDSGSDGDPSDDDEDDARRRLRRADLGPPTDARGAAAARPSGPPRPRPDRTDSVLIGSVERLIRAGVAVTTQALAGPPPVDLTLQQWRVLVLLADSDGLRVGAVAARIGQSLPSASRLVGRLEGRGLVQLDGDPIDRRAVIVRLSVAGRRLARAVLARRRQLIADALVASGDAFPSGTAAAVAALARALDGMA